VIAARELLPDVRDLGRLELVKWLSFVSMVVDHVGIAVYHRSVPELHIVGQFAFPAFCLAFGLGLARSSDPDRVAARLVLPALVAQVAWLWVEQPHGVNVLAMFALCAVARDRLWLVPVAFAVGLLVGEGGPFLPVMVAGAVLAWRLRTAAPLLGAGLGWAALIGSPTAAISALAVAFWPAGVLVPRVPGLLAWGYALHLAALAALFS
jgi:hypothetical protein